jgi:hypothetical protein
VDTEYFDFIGWRRQPYSGKTITVDSAGIRRTLQVDADPGLDTRSIGFFGGSTMWGTGVDDRNTIPSLFSAATARQTINYGESAWISQQSTNQLLRLAIDDAVPDVVVFYDGVNEVLHRCESTNTHHSGPLETEFRAKISWPYVSSLRYAIAPVMRWVGDIKAGAIFKSRSADLPYDCDVNTEKSQQVARSLVENWIVAKSIAERHGATFLPILQPVSYIGEPTISHLLDSDRNPLLDRQYNAVYPLIIQYAKEMGIDFIDLTSILDGPTIYYFDFCHVNARGNSRVVEVLTQSIL